jgi:hypothetical protein
MQAGLVDYFLLRVPKAQTGLGQIPITDAAYAASKHTKLHPGWNMILCLLKAVEQDSSP